MIFRPDIHGRVYGIGVDTQLSDLTGQIALRGKPVTPQGVAESDFEWSVFLNGSRVASQDGAQRTFLDRYGDSFHGRVDILGVIRDAATDALEACTLFFAYPVGKTVILSWSDIPTDADFDAYLLYYDAGLGGAVDTLLAEITERETTSYVVTDLDSGDYVFKLLYRDTAGNIGNGETGDLGLTAAVTLSTPPDAPAIASISVVGRTLVASLTPPTNTTGIVGYFWALNQHPEFGELPYPETAPEHCIVGDSLSYPAFAGRWSIGCYAINKYGVASEVAMDAVTLAEDGHGELIIVENVTRPDMIVDLSAESLAAASVKLTCTATLAAGGYVQFERADDQAGPFSVVNQVNTDETPDGVYILTDSGLDDGTLYWYRAVGVNGDGSGNYIAGDYCEPVQALADGTPPTGDQVLTATVRV